MNSGAPELEVGVLTGKKQKMYNGDQTDVRSCRENRCPFFSKLVGKVFAVRPTVSEKPSAFGGQIQFHGSFIQIAF